MEKKRLLDIKNAVDKAVLQATINTRKEMSDRHQVDIERLMKVKNNEIVQLKKIDKMILDKTKNDNIKKMNKIITVYNSMRSALSTCKRSAFDLAAKRALPKPVTTKPVVVNKPVSTKPVVVNKPVSTKPVVVNKPVITRGKFIVAHRQTLARQLARRRAAYAKFIAKYDDDEDEDYDEDEEDHDEDHDEDYEEEH